MFNHQSIKITTDSFSHSTSLTGLTWTCIFWLTSYSVEKYFYFFGNLLLTRFFKPHLNKNNNVCARCLLVFLKDPRGGWVQYYLSSGKKDKKGIRIFFLHTKPGDEHAGCSCNTCFGHEFRREETEGSAAQSETPLGR